VTRTYIDSCVLIAAARGTGKLGERALAVLADERREFVYSDYVRIEVMPKATYYRRTSEIQFYERLFANAVFWVSFDETLWQAAYEEACASGLSAFDALHVTAAALTSCDELITTERPTSAIHRTRKIRVVTIA